MSVRRLLQEVDSRELTQWMAFYRIEARENSDKKDPKGVNEDIKKGLGFYTRGKK